MLQEELFEGGSFAVELRPNRPRHTHDLMRSLIETTDLPDRLSLNPFRRAAE
jgi:hypothetical protein